MSNWCRVGGLQVAIWLLATAPGSSLFFHNFLDQGLNTKPQAGVGQDETNARPPTRSTRQRSVFDQQAETSRPIQSFNHPHGPMAGEQSSYLHSEYRNTKPHLQSHHISRRPAPLHYIPQEPPLYRHQYCHADEETCRPPITRPRSEQGSHVDQACKWRLAFKAVRGSGQLVYDYMDAGYINEGVEAAKTLSSSLIYRDGNILDRWEQLLVQQVKIELFSEGERQVWFLFDGLGSRMNSWMSQRRLIASSYNTPLKTFSDAVFEVESCTYPDQLFCVSEGPCACSSNCAIFGLHDDCSSPCPWEDDDTGPYFVYKTPSNPESLFEQDGEISCGDRVLISAKICDVDQWID